jgi:hypothetical protein
MPFAFSAFSYPRPQQRPSRVTCRRLNALSQWREIGLTTFLLLPTQQLPWASPVSACLSPGGALATCIQTEGMQPATHLLVKACQQLWLFKAHEGSDDSSLTLRIRNLPSLHTALIAGSVGPLSPGRTFFRGVHCSRSFIPDRYPSSMSG